MEVSRSQFIRVRGLTCHIRHWGREGAPQLFMLHGWMDMSASFQFVVDCLQRDWHVIAPDWRGFGLSQWSAADSYWYPDYLADLDAILQHYSPVAAVNLLGHSLGGNVATIYAGVRPQRIASLINLEGLGLPANTPQHMPGRYAAWLDELRHPPTLKGYASQVEVMRRLQKNNPRLSDARADFLSGYWAGLNAHGSWEILADPAHKKINPTLYQVEEALACWRAIAAPVLWVEAADSDLSKWADSREQARLEIDRRIAVIPNVTVVRIPDAGHMLHHDQPQLLAAAIETFLA